MPENFRRVGPFWLQVHDDYFDPVAGRWTRERLTVRLGFGHTAFLTLKDIRNNWEPTFSQRNGLDNRLRIMRGRWMLTIGL